MQYEKEEAEKKIIELNATISSLEHDKTRSHTFDTSEFKVNYVNVDPVITVQCVIDPVVTVQCVIDPVVTVQCMCY